MRSSAHHPSDRICWGIAAFGLGSSTIQGIPSPSTQIHSFRLFKTAVSYFPPVSRDYFRLPTVLPPWTPPKDHSSPEPIFRPTLPSLDPSAPRYWSGVTSAPQGGVPPSTTLPTPPTAETEVFKSEGQPREATFNVATAAVQHPGMGTALDALNAPSSLTARRQAASHLPNFELPPPQLTPFAGNQGQKYPPLSTINAIQPTPANVSVGNLLTPPSNAPGDSLSPNSSGVNSNNTPSHPGLPPYTPSYWATGTTPYGFGSGSTPQGWSQSINPLFPPRGMFSPSLGSLMRNNSNSPNASEGLPPPPYDINQLPPFHTSLSMSAPSSMPTTAVQQQAMANALMTAQNAVSASHSSPVNAAEAYGQKPPPTPTMYGGSQPSSTPQQGNFPNAYGPSPVQQSPLSASAPASRISPTGQSPVGQGPQHGHFPRPPYPSYSLPAMQGPIMTNLHSPGSQMSLVGHMPTGMMPGFNSGHAASMQQMYGQHPHHQQQQPPNDRPFKCDQCPQSFNRNHDLKRHKRIHLAVKPFPCAHCDKSFSRKDALKVRHGSKKRLQLLALINPTEAYPSERMW